VLGLVDVTTDREVWMLYSSFVRRLGPGFIWSYGAEASSIAVGSTQRSTGYPEPSASPVAEMGGILSRPAPGYPLVR
jgi:hypothetical protein